MRARDSARTPADIAGQARASSAAAASSPTQCACAQVINATYASCTGLSIFLVDALRAVGVPARAAAPPPPASLPAGHARPAALTSHGRC